MKTVDTVQSALAPAVAALGFEIIDVEFKKEQGNWVLTLYIDSPNGITIDDCETVSKAVDPMLDELDPIEQPYYLSVSSPGLDRPLKKDADYGRSIGKAVDVKLYAPMDGKKELSGVLKSFDADGFIIAADKKGISVEIAIARKDAALVRPHLDF